MADIPLRIKVEFVDRKARVGIERLKRQTRTALDPMNKAAIKVRASLKKLGIEGDKAGKKIKKSMQGGAFAIRGIATEMESALRTFAFGITAVTAAGGLLARQAVNMSAEFEVLKITFESLTGSISQADQLIRDMKIFAVKTPLQLKDIQEAGTILLAFGERAADVIPILNLLGEAATAMNKPLEQFIRVRNLLAQGVVLSRMLAPLGISREMLEQFGAGAGATGVELVAAFDKALGRFEGLFVKTFDTIRGRVSNLKDELDIMFAAMGDPVRDVLIGTIDQITGFLAQVRTFFEENRDAIEAAFRSIKTSAEAFLAPITNVLGKFFADLRDNPAKIQELADAFVNLSKAAARLLIFGTVSVGFLKFVAAVTLLRISLPHLLATLGLSIKAVGGLGLAFTVLNPVALAITAAVTLITGALILHNELVIKASAETAKLRKEMEDQLESLEAIKVGVDGLTLTYNRLKDSTKTNEEKFTELRNQMQLIINLHPEFLRQLGLTVTTSGQLVNEFGNVINTWGELTTVWDSYDSGNVVTQINNITNALTNLSRQQFMERPLSWTEIWQTLTVPGINIGEERAKAWFEMQTARMNLEQPGMLGRFFEQFAGADVDEDDDRVPGARAGKAPVDKFADAIAKFRNEINATSERLRLNLITDRDNQEERNSALRGFIDDLIKLKSEVGLTIRQQLLLNAASAGFLENLEKLAMPSIWEPFIEGLQNATEAFNDIVESVRRTTQAYLNQIGIYTTQQKLQQELMRQWFMLLDESIQMRLLTQTGIIGEPGFKGIQTFADKIREFINLFIDESEDIKDYLEEISTDFMNNLSRTLGDFLAQWGRTGGKPDIAGMGLDILKPAATQWGIDLAAKWNTGGFMAGPIAGLIMAGAGWGLSRLMGEEPLKIEQPIDIRIVDIETRLKNFFNFRGLDPFTFRSSFREAFENGVY